MLEGSSIAAILTGILALSGGLATAYMSGWNQRRTERHKNRKALARYAVPLLIASWDLANWFYDIMEDANYSPKRCEAYGNGWNSQFTSYLLGQYFAGVHILRLKTHFLAHIKGAQGLALKKLLWKIQDEFITMEYDDRESLEMRWFEGDILSVQEHMTEDADLNGDGIKGEMQPVGYNDFQKMYALKEEGNEDSPELKKIFEWYENEFQRVVYRRFKQLYATKWPSDVNPQQIEMCDADDKVTIDRYLAEEKIIEKERKGNPNARMLIPDHRIRRLQHLLVDLVIQLDQVSLMHFNRPVRRCGMLSLDSSDRVPCDCDSVECNPSKSDFKHRHVQDPKAGAARSYAARRAVTWQSQTGPKKRKTAEEVSESPC